MSQLVLDAFMRMTPRDIDRDAYDDPRVHEYLKAQIMHFPSFALPDVQSPAAVCGLVHAFGTGTIWMVTGIDFDAQVRRILPMQRQMLAGLYAALRLHRMDMEVSSLDDAGLRYAPHLGFEFDYIQRRGGVKGEDLHVFVWPEKAERGAL